MAGNVSGEASGGADRLETLSDGVFSIAITLLVLDLSVPPGLDGQDFRDALNKTIPHLASYALTFAVIAEFWRDHRSILGTFAKVDLRVIWLTLLGLGLTALLPFPTALLAEYSSQPLAVALYAGCVAALNAVHLSLLLTSYRRLGPASDPMTARSRGLDVASLGSIVLTFGIAVPLALVSPTAAKVLWLFVIPAKVFIERLKVRTHSSAPDSSV